MDLIVLQNDDREPVLEVLVQLEGNTFQADMQCALGQVLPNWYTNRTKYTLDGETVPKKDRDNRPMRDQPQNAQLGTPKISSNIYSAHERVHWVNVISHTETTEDSKPEVRVRILQRNAGQQKSKWETRKEQLLKHLVDNQDVNDQLAVEKATYMNPLQTQRADGTWGSPLYSNLMPTEYKRWIAERKSDLDYRKDYIYKSKHALFSIYYDQ